MSYLELKQALIEKLDKTRHAVEYRARKAKTQYGPMSTQVAIGLIAHREGLDISKYLDSAEVEQVRLIVRQANPPEPPQSPKMRRKTKRVINVTIAGEFRLSDPLLPKHVLEEAKAMANIYAELYVFENSVREVIMRVLSSTYGSNWWDTCVPQGVRKCAESRMQDDERNAWHGKRGDHPIHYIDISAYTSIIRANWTEFNDIFPSQQWVFERIDEIARSRNVVDHHNPLCDVDEKRIKVFFADWCRQIEAAKDILN